MGDNQPIHIGVLFSKSGWTAITERSMLSATLFAIKEINELWSMENRELIPVYGDPKGNPSIYKEMSHELLSDKGVRIILGCYTSSQRKAVLSALDEEQGLLCYPAQYEGFEYSKNIIYFGAVPNQNSAFLGTYILDNYVPKLFIVGSDYVWPRESGRIMQEMIQSHGGEVLGQRYLREDASLDEFDRLIKDIISCGPSIIFNNFVGKSNEKFYKAYVNNGLDAQKMPVASLTTSEADIKKVGASAASGHITAATYFQSQDNPTNTACLQRYQSASGHPLSVNMCWEAAYTQTHMVARAMRQCDSDNINLVRSMILGASFDAPQGEVMIDPFNSHIHVWPKIGIARENGQFDIVAETDHAIRPDPYQTTYTMEEEDERLQAFH